MDGGREGGGKRGERGREIRREIMLFTVKWEERGGKRNDGEKRIKERMRKGRKTGKRNR